MAILSDNDLEHLTLALGAHVGRRAVRAGLAGVFAAVAGLRQAAAHPRHADAGPGVRQRRPPIGKAIAAVVPADVDGGADQRRRLAGRRATRRFDDLLASRARRRGCARRTRQVGPDTIAKFLFTSGSTKQPKGVINTHRMLCANQQMLRQCMRLPGRRAAGAGRLAAVEPHLRRQPQRRHRALQRRHAVHRRRQADAQGHRRDAAQPARDLAHDLLQRAQGLRGDRRARWTATTQLREHAVHARARPSCSPAPA